MSSPNPPSGPSYNRASNPRYPRATVERPNPSKPRGALRTGPVPAGFPVVPAPITPRAPQALAPPPEASPAETPPTHVRARAPWASRDCRAALKARALEAQGCCAPGWGQRGSGRSRSWAVLGEAVAWRGRRPIRRWEGARALGRSVSGPEAPARPLAPTHARSSALRRPRVAGGSGALLTPGAPPGCTRPRHAATSASRCSDTAPSPRMGLRLPWRRVNRCSAFLGCRGSYSGQRADWIVVSQALYVVLTL